MKAIRINQPGDIAIVELPVPAIEAPTQVLVQVKYVGICGSDLHILHGSNPFVTYPRIFGHEMAGEVVGTGAEVTRLKAGDHVILEPIRYCGKCYACTHGEPNVCEHLKVSGVHVEGAASEYLVAEEKQLHKISPAVPWKTAVLTEPLTIGSQACERGRVGRGDTVLISGAGTIGLCALLNAKLRGATCIITDVVEDKLVYARSLGADRTINVAGEDMAQAVRQMVGETGINVYIDAVGLAGAVEQALDLIAPAGRIVLLGFGTEVVRVPFLSMTKKQTELLGSRLQANQFPGVIRNIEENRFPLDGFVNCEYDLEQAKEAFEYAQAHAGEYRKLIIGISHKGAGTQP